MNVKLLLVSSLEKVFTDTEPLAFDGKIEGFRNETVSFQAAWTCTDPDFTRDYVAVKVESPIAQCVRVRSVRNIGVLFPTYADADQNYLRREPGLYPDMLEEIQKDRQRIRANSWQSAWLDVENAPAAGTYPIDVVLCASDNTELARAHAEYTCLDAELPAQTLIRTQWFHNDCLCQYYHVPMFSEEYWRIAENFMRTAAKRGINCLLTPTHTPPLDTAVGGERMTCQLVDVKKTDDGYTFGFEKLHRWVETAQRVGIEYFEIAHLFTQWGAEHAPKIIADVNGTETKIFGWETEATGDDYVAFLREYIPALVRELRTMGIADKTLFHVSDEPNATHLENYMKAKSIIKPLLEDFTIIDALSNVQFYYSGAVDHPVPSNNHIKPFLEANIDGLWTYYCCGQYKDVSNAFVAMPSARTRILGVQMYKYRIAGFLQWGYNFYNSQYSEYPIDPYVTNDGDGFTPAGDCFIVYPGADRNPVESIRLMLMYEAMTDMRALNMLESLKGREFTMRLVDSATTSIEFDKYPTSPNYLLQLRKRVNAEIMSAIENK